MALSSVHAPTSETDVSEQIKIKAVNILFPLISWSRLFSETPQTAHERLPKQEARQVSGATGGATLSNGKQRVLYWGMPTGESTTVEMGTAVVRRQADVGGRSRKSPTKPEGCAPALPVQNEIFETTTDKGLPARVMKGFRL
jgi:hypothetical protein